MLCKQLKQVDGVKNDWKASLHGMVKWQTQEDPGKQHSAELKSKCRVYKTETKKRNRRPLWWTEGREQGESGTG